jgi:carboxymethylenebutenolidase
MRETFESVRTKDGEMPAFVFHPEKEGQSWPTVLWLMDGPGIRQGLRDMASRLATAGYCVVLPYAFYRNGPYREFGPSTQDVELRRSYHKTMSTDKALEDIEALQSYCKDLPASSDGPIGVIGYCMSGSWAIAAAREFSGRVAAAASVHGGELVTDEESSPHRNLEGIRARLYIAWADQDPTAPAEGVPTFRAAVKEAGIEGEVEFMAGALHGFAATTNPQYHRGAAERHWEQLHDLFGGLRS